MHRFFLEAAQLSPTHAHIEGEIAHQIKHVLRLAVGDSVILLDDSGMEYVAALDSIGKTHISAVIQEARPNLNELHTRITLYQALLRRDNFEWVLQKATEIGVTRIVPLMTRRVVAKSESQGKQTRWQRIITEAAEQSRRGRLPRLDEPTAWATALIQFTSHELLFIPYENAAPDGHLLRVIQGRTVQDVAVIIGPEGGFAEEEVQAAQAAGAIPVSLGRLTLRAETAAVYALSLVSAHGG